MNLAAEQTLISKLRMLSPEQVAEVNDFIEFLATKSRKRAALDRLLAIAPELDTASSQPPSEDEIEAEVLAARAERRIRREAQSGAVPLHRPGADRP